MPRGASTATASSCDAAVYSPCDLCKNDPSAPPAWQLKAREITDDKDLKLIEFRDAMIEVDGWPVFYTPYLSEPDPSVKRASGFLMPSFGNSSTIGFHVATPYYLVLGPDKDLTLTPRFTTQAGQLLAGEYRQRFSNGNARCDRQRELQQCRIRQRHRHRQANGAATSTPPGCGISTTPTGPGLRCSASPTRPTCCASASARRCLNAMISRAYLEGFEPNGATDVDAYMFQPLQPGLGDSTQPIVLPVINRTWQSEPDGLGGVWKVNANLLDIVREVGTQTRRISLGSEWDKTFRDGIGGEYKFIASVRGDGYSVSDLSNLSNPDLPTAFFSVERRAAGATRSATIISTGRAFPQVGLTWDYPLARRSETTTAIIEPIVGGLCRPLRRQQPAHPGRGQPRFRIPRLRPVPAGPTSGL